MLQLDEMFLKSADVLYIRDSYRRPRALGVILYTFIEQRLVEGGHLKCIQALDLQSVEFNCKSDLPILK